MVRGPKKKKEPLNSLDPMQIGPSFTQVTTITVGQLVQEVSLARDKAETQKEWSAINHVKSKQPN